MVAPPTENELEDNPITFMSQQEIDEYYAAATYELSGKLMIKDELTKPEYEFRVQSDRLNVVMQQVAAIADKVGIDSWDTHTDLLHSYFRNPHILQSYYICKNKAFLKLSEIFDQFPFDSRCKGEFRTFHLCEGPGYFIEATYYARIKSGVSRNGTWEWAANTLNPYFENVSCFDKLVDDSHIREHLEKWHFGPSGDGDVRSLTEDYLIKKQLAGTFDLVTADGSTNTQGNESSLEAIVAPIIEAEVKAALMLLRTGGRLIIKVYRLNNKNTRDLLELLAENFVIIRAFKPMASRPGSSEKYLICDGFGGKCEVKKTMMVQCDENFLNRQLQRIRQHIESYVCAETPYCDEHRRAFLRYMRPRMFNSLSGRVLDHLQKLFPRKRETSPWIGLYGHNLIRRLNPQNIENGVDHYLLTGDVRDPEELEFLNIELICNEITRQTQTFITSDVPLVSNDSMFIEPLAFKALQTHYRQRYFDIFESTSVVAPDSNRWREHFKQVVEDSKHHVSLVIHPVVTLESLLLALVEGYDHEMESFTVIMSPQNASKIPLFLSRLSASIYVVLMTLFERCAALESGLRFHTPRHLPCTRTLICHLLSSAGRLPVGIGIRSFLPLNVIDMAHSRVVYHNLTMLNSLNQ